MKTVAIVYGGYSSEAGVSEKSLAGLLTFIPTDVYNLVPVFISREEWSAVVDGKHLPIDRTDFSFVLNGAKQRIDYAYITIHGEPGENGQLVGYFEMIGMPHSTCPALASAMTYNKFVCNTFLGACGVNVAKRHLLRKDDNIDEAALVAELGLPMFIKPAAGGSSFGVTKVKDASEIKAAVAKALNESEDVVCEESLNGTEVTCGMYKTKNEYVMLPLTEVVSSNEFFDYEAKYTPGKAQEITPARVSDAIRDKVYAEARKVYSLMQMHGIVRIDFIIVGEKPYLMEVNTTPGMTQTSFIPQQIAASGRSMKEVFTTIIEN